MNIFKELYTQCEIYMEDGDMESIEGMDWDMIRKASKEEISSNDSPQGHYLLATYYIIQNEIEKGMEEKLKAAELGCCVSAVDYSSYVECEGIEILGIVKAMNDAGHGLSSLQEDIDMEMGAIKENGDLEVMNQIEKKASEVKKNMTDRSLNFYW